MMTNLRKPLSSNILKTCWIDQREADQENISLWVRKWPQSIVILLTSCIPKAEVYWFTIYHDIRRVIVKHCRDVFAWKGIGSVADQQACFTHRTVQRNVIFIRLRMEIFVKRLVDVFTQSKDFFKRFRRF